MEHEKYSYVEALRWLALRYNVEVEETETSPEYREQQQLADSLHILNQFAAKYFASQLKESEEGRNNALSYLKERGFNDETIEKFQLGYCLNQRDAFAREAIKSQYSNDLLKKSGLCIERDGQLVDNYRGVSSSPSTTKAARSLDLGQGSLEAAIVARNTSTPLRMNSISRAGSCMDRSSRGIPLTRPMNVSW